MAGRDAIRSRTRRFRREYALSLDDMVTIMTI